MLSKNVSSVVQLKILRPEKLKLLPPFQDPYFRFNDVSYRWIALENWTYSTTFAFSAHLRSDANFFFSVLLGPAADIFLTFRSRQEVELIFDGVDTVASITLNGNLVGKTDNMFRRYVSPLRRFPHFHVHAPPSCKAVFFLEQDFSVRELLKEADNLLQVQFLSPVVYASERSKAHQSYRVPPQCPPDVQKGECHVNFIRKVRRPHLLFLCLRMCLQGVLIH